MRSNVAIFLLFVLLPVTSYAQERGDGWGVALLIDEVPGSLISYRHFTTPYACVITSLSVRQFKNKNVANYSFSGSSYDSTYTNYYIEAGVRRYGNSGKSPLYSEIVFGLTSGERKDEGVQSTTGAIDDTTSYRYFNARAQFGGEYRISNSWFFEAKYGLAFYRLLSQDDRANSSDGGIVYSGDRSSQRIFTSSEISFVYYF